MAISTPCILAGIRFASQPTLKLDATTYTIPTDPAQLYYVGQGWATPGTDLLTLINTTIQGTVPSFSLAIGSTDADLRANRVVATWTGGSRTLYYTGSNATLCAILGFAADYTATNPTASNISSTTTGRYFWVPTRYEGASVYETDRSFSMDSRHEPRTRYIHRESVSGIPHGYSISLNSTYTRSFQIPFVAKELIYQEYEEIGSRQTKSLERIWKDSLSKGYKFVIYDDYATRASSSDYTVGWLRNPDKIPWSRMDARSLFRFLVSMDMLVNSYG